MFLKNIKYRKNAQRLRNICSDLINNYEKQEFKPSCHDDIMKLINGRILSAKEEISTWEDYDTDYITIAHSLLANAAFDLLVSGKYHIYYGMLNPMSCSDNLFDVYKMCMQYAEDKHEIDPDTRKEQYQLLLQCIAEAG